MSAYSDAVLADSPVLYLRLDETSGTSCANAGSLGGNATTTGAVTRNVTAAHANLGVACDLAGTTSDYITHPDNAALDITGDVTYEAWVKFDAFAATQTFLSKGSDDASTGGYGFLLLANRAFRIQRANLANLVTTTALYPNDTGWHHVAFTRIGNNFVIYVDGASIETGSNATAVQATTKAMHIGVNPGHTVALASPLDGKIDEVAVYNTGLSAARILAHYNAYNAAPAGPVFVPQIVIT